LLQNHFVIVDLGLGAGRQVGLQKLGIHCAQFLMMESLSLAVPR
jgi:hypothetical protein